MTSKQCVQRADSLAMPVQLRDNGSMNTQVPCQCQYKGVSLWWQGALEVLNTGLSRRAGPPQDLIKAASGLKARMDHADAEPDTSQVTLPAPNPAQLRVCIDLMMTAISLLSWNSLTACSSSVHGTASSLPNKQ